MAAHPAQHRIAVEISFVIGRAHHLDAGINQECAEQVQDPVVARDQCGTDEDEDGAQHDGAKNADHQRALLQLRTDPEAGEDQQEHEDVVDGQGLFDDITGKELQGRFIGQRRIAVLPEPVPEAQVEQHGQHDPGDAPDRRFLVGNLVRATGPHHRKVDDQGDHDQQAECEPEPGRTDGVHVTAPETGKAPRRRRRMGPRRDTGTLHRRTAKVLPASSAEFGTCLPDRGRRGGPC